MTRSRILRTNNPSRARRLERRATLPPPPAPSIDPPPVVLSTEQPTDEDDEVATHFFSTPPPEVIETAFVAPEPEPELEAPRRTVAPARRARFLRVVTMSMIACSLLCVTAALRVALTKGRSEVHAAALSAPVVVAPPPETASVPIVTAPPAVATAEPAPTVDPRWADAKAATHAAIVALEMRKVSDAIEAATAATLLDAADGEAWLVLGAAYQDAGRMSEALEAYRTCRLHARVDPRGECGAMLRSFTFTGR